MTTTVPRPGLVTEHHQFRAEQDKEPRGKRVGKHIHGFTLSEGKGAHTPSCQPPSGAGISQPLPPAPVSKAVVTAVTPLRSGCLEGPGTGFLLGVLGRDLHSCTLPLYKKQWCPRALLHTSHLP